MNKGVKLRQIIHNILYEVYKYNYSLDDLYLKNKIFDLSDSDIAFITSSTYIKSLE